MDESSEEAARQPGRAFRAVRDTTAFAGLIASFAGLAHSLFPFLAERFSKTGVQVVTAVATACFLAAVTVAWAYSLFVARRFQRALKTVQEQQDRVWSAEAQADLTVLSKAAEDVDARVDIGVTAPAIASRTTPDNSAIYLRGIGLENIRCFDQLAIGLEDVEGPYLTTVILGDNAAGKTTVLRSMALGLCPESDAVSLINDVPGGFLRKGADRGVITVHVRSAAGDFRGTIETTIEQVNGEIIRQKTWPPEFPWERIFVCGYGTHRSAGRPSSHDRYAARFGVASLFSDKADLLNPEIALLRRSPETRARLEEILKQVLLLEDHDAVQTGTNGIELHGPWGAMPIAAMSDGYRSTMQWVLDYLGWQMFANRLESSSMDGLLLIDELEQHLHPRWQRHILQRLRAQLGQTQIIASTHTPLVAAGVADLKRSQVIRLAPQNNGMIGATKIPSDEFSGKRADQVLADAFGLITSKSPGTIAKIDRYTELLSGDRSDAEQHELDALKKELEVGWSAGDNAVMRQADQAVSSVLDEMLDAGVQRAAVDARVRQRLADLLGGVEPGS